LYALDSSVCSLAQFVQVHIKLSAITVCCCWGEWH